MNSFKKLYFALSIFLLLISSPVFSWWATGHEIVAAIAYSNLSPVAKENVVKLLKKQLSWPSAKATNYLPSPLALSQKLNTYILASSWADAIANYTWKGAQGEKKRVAYKSMHFMDNDIDFTIPDVGGAVRKNCSLVNWQKVVYETDQASLHDNVLFGIKSSIKTLLMQNKTSMEKAIALRFLIHFVADMYMPFHSGNPVFEFRDAAGIHKINTHGANLISFSNDQEILVPDCADPYYPSDTIVTSWHKFWDAGIGICYNAPEPSASDYAPFAWQDWQKYGKQYKDYIINKAFSIKRFYKNDKRLNIQIVNHPSIQYWAAYTAQTACKLLSAENYGKNLAFNVAKIYLADSKSQADKYKVIVKFTKGGVKAYQHEVGFIVSRQLYIAGMHLAGLLNAIFNSGNKNYQIYIKNIVADRNVKPLNELVDNIVAHS